MRIKHTFYERTTKRMEPRQKFAFSKIDRMRVIIIKKKKKK